MNRLRSAAIIAFWLHLLAGASMALVLRRGLETNPNFQDRLAFIVNQRALWIAGWLTWTAAAIAADLSGQAIEIGVLPGLAARVDFFTAFHRTAVMMSGYVANGMYSLSALVLSWSTRRSYPVWVSSAGILTGCFGLALSTAALMDSASGMLWMNVFLVPCILLWLAGVARR